MLYGMACAPACLGLARSAERDAVLVRCHPLVERLQLGIQRTRELNAAVASVEVVEVGLKLEHVPDVVGAGEFKASEDLGRHAVVAHLLAERSRAGGVAPRAARSLAWHCDSLAAHPADTLEDPVGAFADILDGDARELLLAHRVGDGQYAVLAALRAEAEEDEVLPVKRG